MLGFRNNLLCLVFAILLVSFSFAIDVSSCWQINESGSYDLTQNISGAMPVSGIYFTYNACIIISAPNVTFNCAGYNVTNNASTDAAGILVNGTNTGHENVTIENCPGITGFERSIYLHNTTRDVIRNVTVYDSDYGIVLHESTHNHLYNISLYNVSHRGLHLGGSSQYNSDYNNISNVSVYDIGYGAIAYAVSVGGDYNNLTNISISNTSTYGFYIDGGASHNQLRGSTIRNTRGGIYIRGSNNTVADTITHSSEEYGAQISGSEVNFTDNTIYNNSIYGVRVYSSANYFTMFNNTVYNNSYNGEIRIENSNYSKILDSDILHNGYTAGIRTEYADYYLFANNTLYNNTLEGIYSYYSDNGTIINNTAYGNGASGIYTRYSDYINTTNNTLYSNGGSGFRAISADHGIISNNTAYGNTEYGFQIGYYAYNSSVTNNIAHNNTLNGFHLDASEDSNLTDNVAADNGGSGFNLQYASNCTLRDSLTYGNNGSGVYYYGMGAGTVSNITIRDNLRYGLYVYADDANVANNTIHDNVGGVCLDGGISSYITNNTIYNDPVYGIYLNQSYSNIFSDNTIYNATYGISAFASFYATYANTTVYNTSYGIYLLYGNSSRILNNEVYDSEYGIYLDAFNYLGIVTVASDYNNVTGNSIYNNSVYGVYSNITTEVIFSNNTLYSNGYAFYNLGSNYTMETCLFLNSSGDFSAYANLSATDIANSSEEYSINWSAAPSSVPTDKTSFEDKFVNITTHAGNVSIDSISWLWDESEASGHTEADFSLWSYNSSGAWTLLNDTPDTTSNVLRQYDMNPASIYGIFEGTDSENVSTTDPGGSDSDFECFTSSDCDDCYVCSDHECILPAGTCASPADCTGAYQFYSCDECSCNGYDCIYDDDCEEGYTCEEGECIPPECLWDSDCESHGEGYSCTDYVCTPPECLLDSDCGAGYACMNYTCIPPECFSDADCPSGEMCENYNCVPWGCRSNSDCNGGFYCDDGVCKKESIPGGPGSSSGGSSGGSGTPSGQGGEAEVPSEEEGPGTEQVAQAFPFLEGDSSGGIIPEIVFSEETRVSSGWIIIFLLVIVAAIYFLHHKKRERREEE